MVTSSRRTFPSSLANHSRQVVSVPVDYIVYIYVEHTGHIVEWPWDVCSKKSPSLFMPIYFSPLYLSLPRTIQMMQTKKKEKESSEGILQTLFFVVYRLSLLRLSTQHPPRRPPTLVGADFFFRPDLPSEGTRLRYWFDKSIFFFFTGNKYLRTSSTFEKISLSFALTVDLWFLVHRDVICFKCQRVHKCREWHQSHRKKKTNEWRMAFKHFLNGENHILRWEAAAGHLSDIRVRRHSTFGERSFKGSANARSLLKQELWLRVKAMWLIKASDRLTESNRLWSFCLPVSQRPTR